jgi:hypothetical protein
MSMPYLLRRSGVILIAAEAFLGGIGCLVGDNSFLGFAMSVSLSGAFRSKRNEFVCPPVSWVTR